MNPTAIARTQSPHHVNGVHLGLALSRRLSPERIFILSFAGVILAGALLLSLPVSGGVRPVPWVDALFQSTSAMRVTGLASIDVGKDLSLAMTLGEHPADPPPQGAEGQDDLRQGAQRGLQAHPDEGGGERGHYP